jgi:hypothetical protein
MATWNIIELERNAADGGVITAHYLATDKDGDYGAESRGIVQFTPDPSDSNFIPYADLTEADVVAWVKAKEDVTSVENFLAAQIAEQKSPVTIDGLPWK